MRIAVVGSRSKGLCAKHLPTRSKHTFVRKTQVGERFSAWEIELWRGSRSLWMTSLLKTATRGQGSREPKFICCVWRGYRPHESKRMMPHR